MSKPYRQIRPMSKTELERMQKSIEGRHSARIKTIAALHNKTVNSKLVFGDQAV